MPLGMHLPAESNWDHDICRLCYRLKAKVRFNIVIPPSVHFSSAAISDKNFMPPNQKTLNSSTKHLVNSSTESLLLLARAFHSLFFPPRASFLDFSRDSHFLSILVFFYPRHQQSYLISLAPAHAHSRFSETGKFVRKNFEV